MRGTLSSGLPEFTQALLEKRFSHEAKSSATRVYQQHSRTLTPSVIHYKIQQQPRPEQVRAASSGEQGRHGMYVQQTMLFSTKINITALAEHKQRQTSKDNKTHNNFPHSPTP